MSEQLTKGGIALLFVVLAAAASSARAFHFGGVAECQNCHSTHNSLEGSANTGMPQFSSAQDQSGACLNCHGDVSTPSGYRVATEGVNAVDSTLPPEMTPGGDFVWLKKDALPADTRGRIIRTHAKRKSPSIVAVDSLDPVAGVSAVGAYRILGRQGNQPNALPTRLQCNKCHAKD